MTATIHFSGLDSETFARFRAVIKQETEQLTPAWIVSVNGAQRDDLWQVEIEHSGRQLKSETFDDATGEHDPDAFRYKLRRMLRS